MQKIILKPLKSKKQLRRLSFQEVVSAGFTDDSEQTFEIAFDTDEGKIDITICFATRTPKVYLSEPYKEG